MNDDYALQHFYTHKGAAGLKILVIKDILTESLIG